MADTTYTDTYATNYSQSNPPSESSSEGYDVNEAYEAKSDSYSAASYNVASYSEPFNYSTNYSDIPQLHNKYSASNPEPTTNYSSTAYDTDTSYGYNSKDSQASDKSRDKPKVEKKSAEEKAVEAQAKLSATRWNEEMLLALLKEQDPTLNQQEGRRAIVESVREFAAKFVETVKAAGAFQFDIHRSTCSLNSCS